MAILKAHDPGPEHQVSEQPSQITMKNEIVRKSIHLTSIGIPIIYYFVTRETMLILVAPAAALALVTDVVRFRAPKIDTIFRRWFGPILRPHERSAEKPKMNGATFVLLSAVFCILIFPKAITITAFTVLIVSDTAGALIGRPFGRHKFLQKSLEGSLAFVVTAILAVLVWRALFDAPWEFFYIGVVASLAAAVAEAMSYGINIDDNFTIPATFGSIMWGALALIGGAAIEALLRIP